MPTESWSQCLYASTSEDAEAELAGLLGQHAALARALRPSSARSVLGPWSVHGSVLLEHYLHARMPARCMLPDDLNGTC